MRESTLFASGIVRVAMSKTFDELRNRLAEISDLGKASALLAWDQQTKMPPRGAPVRAEQLATVGRIAHEKFTSPEVGRLLDELADFEQQHEYDSFEASLIRAARGDVALVGARAPGLGGGAQVERLRELPAGAAQESRPAQAVRRDLRRR